MNEHEGGFAAERRSKLDVFLGQNVLEDATKLAHATSTDIGVVFWAAWEAVKPEACARFPGGDGSIARFAAGQSAPALAPPQQDAPKLGARTKATPKLVRLYVPKYVEEEIRALSRHAEERYGAVANQVYLLARERLWRGAGR